MWKGVIIEESLGNTKPLELVRIVGTKKTTLEKESEKGVLHFHKIELDDNKKNKFIKLVKKCIKRGWYIHICKNKAMVVIFKSRMFELTKSQKEKLNEARNYGLSIGIIKEQMPFEKLILNPYA